MVILKNTYLTIEIKEAGAELVSIKDMDGVEFLMKDERYWGYTAPHLFPVVGALQNSELIHQGRTYPAKRHGFARNMAFSLTDQTESSATYVLESSEETLPLFPFAFRYTVKYVLDGKSVSIHYKVENTGTEEMAYSIGAHPALLAPRDKRDSFSDHYLEFELFEDLQSISINQKTGLLKRNLIPMGRNVKILNLTKDLFTEDALIFNNLKSEYISLKNRKDNKEVRFHFKGFPFLGIWTTLGESPFICIEPWVGHADYEDFFGEFLEKEDNEHLLPGEAKDYHYALDIRS
jgi:galactose mutarotase-like enzyme